jgi:lipopolysaccharide transport system ATP-binding protein
MATSISAVGLSKRYRSSAGEDGWLDALQDVSFDVEAGEGVGLIGRNGAGKSTLLRTLSRVTRPTAGYADVRGRVGALLEVGTGFHPDLTGRENTYLSGAMLGMSREDVRRRFDEIVAFSEIEAFIDSPVKHYSTGMFARLGFAVAAHLLPDILIVDEVLAVGDLPFQAKCLARMHRLTEDGTTVLFVSHNLLAVADLCGRALVLERGRLVFDGESSAAITTYRDQLVQADDAGRERATKQDIELSIDGERANGRVTATPGSPLRLEVSIGRRDDAQEISVYLNVVIESADGRLLVHLRSDLAGYRLVLEPGGSILCAEITELSLSPGAYSLFVRVVSLQGGEAFIWDSERQALTIPGDARTEALLVPPHRFQQRTLRPVAEPSGR